MRPPEHFFDRYPHQLSGGQQQRVVIAGALTLGPEVLVADEPVSSLDASVRGEILKLFLGLRDELGLAALVVSHDLGLAWNIADRVAVMYLGRIVEVGTVEEVLLPPAPLHPGVARGCPPVGDPELRAARRAARPDRDPPRLPLPSAMPAARPLPEDEGSRAASPTSRCFRGARAPGRLPPRRRRGRARPDGPDDRRGEHVTASAPPYDARRRRGSVPVTGWRC